MSFDLERSLNQTALQLARLHVETSVTDDESRRDTILENSSRPAVVELTFVSKGIGQTRYADVIDFPIDFVTEPHFTTGSAVKRHPDPTNWWDPRGSAGVRSWQRSGNGLFTGARMWFRVDMDAINATSGGTPAIEVIHYLTFTGIASKYVPSADLYEDITPRTVGT